MSMRIYILLKMLRRIAIGPLLPAAFLIVLTFFFAAGSNASDSDSVFQAEFTPSAPLNPAVRVRFPEMTATPLAAYVENVAGKKYAVRFDATSNDILLNLQDVPQGTRKLIVVFRSDSPQIAVEESDVLSGNVRLPGSWGLPISLTTGILTDVTDSLEFYTVAVADTHTVGFNTSTTPISDSGVIWVVFPNGFGLEGIDHAVYGDSDPGNDVDEPVVNAISISEDAVLFQLSSAQQAAAGSRIWVKFWPDTNATIAQQYSIIVMTTKYDGEIDNTPIVSEPFTLAHGPMVRVLVQPDTNFFVPADSVAVLVATARDSYGNAIDSVAFDYDVTVDSCGEISNGLFRALKLGACYVAASANGLNDSSGLITVVPGPLARFSLRGQPDSVVAGNSFRTPVIVTALDSQGNRKYDCLDSMWFATSDSIDDLPFESGNSYHFTLADAGSHAFPGSGFVLKRSGPRRYLMVSNGSAGAVSDPIRVIPAVIDSFAMSVGLTQIAGESFSVTVYNARDEYRNPASGIILVSDSIGGGDSPDGIPPSINNITVTNGSGSALQTMTNADSTMLKGTVSGGAFTATTPLFAVLPGNLGGFDLSNYPDTVVAGSGFPGLTLSVFDIFGNLKINYVGDIYFSSSDTLADIPYGQLPFHFLNQYNGVHVFIEQFTLKTAGEQTITVTDTIASASTQTITVRPDVIAQFALVGPESGVAGLPFQLNVTSCHDLWGNPGDGLVMISDSVGGGPSPNGTPPIFTSIPVRLGSGSASQTLFHAVYTRLQGRVGSVIAATDTIDVGPGNTGRFDFSLSSPQISGRPFSGVADVTAFDLFGNRKSDYNASTDTVVITSNAGGVMTNNVLNQAGDFTQGVADLVSHGTAFRGRGGPMTFLATSESGVGGYSNPVDMNAIFCQGLLINQTIITRGDTATGSISIRNDGGEAATITDLWIFDNNGWISRPITVAQLPDSIGPAQTHTYDLFLPIPIGLDTGYHPLTCAARGMFGPYIVGDTLPGFQDTVFVESASRPAYVAGSLRPETLSTGEYYTLALALQDTGHAGLALIDTSHFQFTDGGRTFRANISSGIFLPAHSPGVNVILDSALVHPDFIAGSYAATFYYYGMENELFVSGGIVISDPVTIQNRADISYILESLSPDSVVVGQNASFSVDVLNAGNARFVLRHSDVRFSFTDSQREYLAFSDTSVGIRVDTLYQGETTIHFSRATIPFEFSIGSYPPRIIIAGSQNGRDEIISLDTSIDSVKVISAASLRIDSTYAMSRQAPFVNTSQPCSIAVVIENRGAEGAQSFYVHLESTGNSAFQESTFVNRLNGQRSLRLVVPSTAGDAPNESEVIAGSILGGTGSVGGNPILIEQPTDNIALLIIETPALLSLSPVSIVSPPEAFDDTISVDQIVMISASVQNAGQATIEGARRLVLDTLNSGFTVRDSVNRDYDLDSPVFWEVIAPHSARDLSTLTLHLLNFPIDSNDGLSAVGADSVSDISFVVNTAPTLSHHAAVTWPDGAGDRTVSTDQFFIVTDTLNAAGIYRDLSVSIVLPSGYSTEDSVFRHPEGDIVNWRLRAPGNASSNDTIMIAGWLYDVNTGDSVGTGPNFIAISTVSAATLQMTSRIIGPPAAIDGIVEPGIQVQFQAVVLNNGQAGVSPGLMIIETGHPDFRVVGSAIMGFTVGTPVTWAIEMPDSEITLPAGIWARINSVPAEENTGEPAAVAIDSAGVNILVKKLLPRLVLNDVIGHRGSAVKGLETAFLAFSILNVDPGGDHDIGITAFSFTTRANPAAPAPGFLSTASLVSDSGVVAGILSGNTIEFAIPDTIYLSPSSNLPFSLLLTVHPGTSARDFTISFDDSFVEAVAIEDGIPTSILTPVMSRGEPVTWESDPTVILEATFSGSLSSYPNPFNPRVGGAKIGYYLASDSNLDIKIFTLLGELVWSKAVSSGEPLGRAGLHTGPTALMWEGRNDNGREIRSGVYICLIKNITTGEEEKFKIAIVK